MFYLHLMLIDRGVGVAWVGARDLYGDGDISFAKSGQVVDDELWVLNVPRNHDVGDCVCNESHQHKIPYK